MVAILRAREVDDFMFKTSLRYEVVERLPSSLKLDWAKFARNHPNSNLADLSSRLYTITENGIMVMATPNQDQRSRGAKKDEFLSFHSESETSEI